MSPDKSARPDDGRGLGRAVLETELTDIQGQRGELRHRGYAIKDLAADPCFERTAYLLLYGEWPTTGQHLAFRADLAARRVLPERTVRMLACLGQHRHDDALRNTLSSLDLGQHDGRPALDIGLDLIAKIPSMIVCLHAIRRGQDPIAPDPTLDHAPDFLRRLLGRRPSPLEEEMINLDFVLHADHGGDGASFAARVVASAGAGMPSAIMAAMSAAAGPLDGGAIRNAQEIVAKLDPSTSPAANDKGDLGAESTERSAYESVDPRCRLYRRALIAMARDAGNRRHGNQQAMALVKALSEALAPSRRAGIDTNISLYAAALYRLLGLPHRLAVSTAMAARSVGWVAHVLEQQRDPAPIRPRLRYVGPLPRTLPGRSRS